MEETSKTNVATPEESGFQLTKEFLELALEREVETFSTSMGTNPGDNYMSIMHGIEVTFKGDNKSNYYLLKCYPANSQGKKEFLDDLFSKELFMYQKFLPQLKELAAESGAENVVDLSVVPVQAGNLAGQPSAKFTETAWSSESFILMTDLRKTSGFTMADRFQGLDLIHTKLALEEIAKLHALSWAYKQKNGMSLLNTKYPQFVGEVDGNADTMKGFCQLMVHLSNSSLQMAEDKLGASHPACKNFKEFIAGYEPERMNAFMRKTGIDEKSVESQLRIQPDEDKDYNYEPWMVASHGDCYLNNMLFLYNDEKKPVAVTLIDWQVIREACPTVDLAYFLYLSVRSSVRIPNLNELLSVYHDAFVRYCEVLQVSVLPGFSMETLARRFRRAQIYALLVPLPLLSIVLKPKENAAKNTEKVDSNEGANIFNSVMVGFDQNELLKDEVSSTILNLYEIGVI
ncbi:hypothetical protein Ocin01_12582 [Orchesella cincta]|uniref:CHK kinase-like domain-containing protein n=1 Tax=Orchesella cincta TaxID=48709 RepID=A0A1D2MMK3_ORCCI|nr:hypothetical protein Ocin01_12582 [Orchesella cincta]